MTGASTQRWREPYVPGGSAPLPPAACLRDPAMQEADEQALADLVAGCRRTSAVADRVCLAVIALAAALFAPNLLAGLL